MKRINRLLGEIKISVNEYIARQRLQKAPLCYTTINDLIHRICSDSINLYTDQHFIYYIDRYIRFHQTQLSESTYKRYLVFMRLLERFEGHCGRRHLVEEINQPFLNAFFSFCKEENYNEQTMLRTVHFFKTILYYIEKIGFKTAINEFEIHNPKLQKFIVTLTEEEIEKIQRTSMSSDLECAKQWLIISCYTGQRFSDFMSFHEEQLCNVAGQKCLDFVQKKTGKRIILPLHQMVEDLLVINRGKFPKKLSLINYNKQIQILAKVAGITAKIQCSKRIGHRVEIIVIEKWQTLTSHVGRRSFATNFYGKIPTALLIEATGHATEQMFLKYINALDTEKIRMLGMHLRRLHNERQIQTYEMNNTCNMT